MEQIIIPLMGNVENDFFEQNPELNYIDEIRKAKTQYGAAQASKYAWAIVLIFHHKSKLSKLDNKHEIVAKNYLGIDVDEFDTLFDDADFKDFRDIILQISMSNLEFELAMNIALVKKNRRLVEDSADPKAITAWLEKAPKIMKDLIVSQNEVNKAVDSETRARRTAKNVQITTFEKNLSPENQPSIYDDINEENA
jgi:hypothetical protein